MFPFSACETAAETPQSWSLVPLIFQTGFREQVIQSSVWIRHGYNPISVDRKYEKRDIAFCDDLDNIYANL